MTENKDLAPQSFVRAIEFSNHTQATVTVSNLTPEPVSVSNQTEILVVSVSNQTKGEINPATIVDPNPLDPYRAAS